MPMKSINRWRILKVKSKQLADLFNSNQKGSKALQPADDEAYLIYIENFLGDLRALQSEMSVIQYQELTQVKESLAKAKHKVRTS